MILQPGMLPAQPGMDMAVQRELTDAVLAHFAGNQTRAAKALGISVQALNRYVIHERVADDRAIEKMSSFLGRNVPKDLATHRAETAPTQRVSDAWAKLAKVATVTIVLGFSALAHEAAVAQVPFSVPVIRPMFIMFWLFASLHIVRRVRSADWHAAGRSRARDSSPSLLA